MRKPVLKTVLPVLKTVFVIAFFAALFSGAMESLPLWAFLPLLVVFFAAIFTGGVDWLPFSGSGRGDVGEGGAGGGDGF
jgi:preprotein translocase subunit SecE